MKEIIEALAALENWSFHYGRNDFHNLFNEVEANVLHVFLDPVKRSKIRNDSGQVEEYVYSGNMLLCYNSDIDEGGDYNKRYEDYIKPILEGNIDTIEQDLICNQEATVEQWEEIELINAFDQNFDGVLITYKTRINA